MGASKFNVAKNALGGLSLQERLLLSISKHPGEVDKTSNYEKPTDQWTVETALKQLLAAFPDFLSEIRGGDVLDYGCGDGFQSVALARSGASSVLGVEIDENRLGHARALAKRENAEAVTFALKIDGKFDAVISLNAMEHFIQPRENLREMRNALKPGGRIYLSFGPPWRAPYGHHMRFFCDWPWINLVFSERTVMGIRRLYRDDDATSYEPGLNKMTVKSFERLVSECGLKIASHEYLCAYTFTWFRRAPFLREFFINEINAVLELAD